MKNDQRESWERLYTRKGELWSKRHDSWFSVHDGERVLDLGCGTGKSIEGLKGHIVGVDFSLAALKRAKRKYQAADFVASDVSRLPFRENTFDLVRASFILGHLDDGQIRSAADEITRVMKREARLAIEVFGTRDGRYGKGEKISKNTYRDGEGIIRRFFEPREIEEIFSTLEKQHLDLVEWSQRVGPNSELKRSVIRSVFRKP